jgi:hypothetical protein
MGQAMEADQLQMLLASVAELTECQLDELDAQF